MKTLLEVLNPEKLLSSPNAVFVKYSQDRWGQPALFSHRKMADGFFLPPVTWGGAAYWDQHADDGLVMGAHPGAITPPMSFAARRNIMRVMVSQRSLV